jgi:hypothetical protein
MRPEIEGHDFVSFVKKKAVRVCHIITLGAVFFESQVPFLN